MTQETPTTTEPVVEEVTPTEETVSDEVVSDQVADDSASTEFDITSIPLTKKPLKAGEYIATIGRRKTATAQVRLSLGNKTSVTVNGLDYTKYFTTSTMQKTVMAPIYKIGLPDDFTITVLVTGSGISAQAVAVRHGIARALTEFVPELRSPLKRSGFLKRDPRSKERRKPGLKKARKAAQWSKR
jgi:small subunit ribosomal protein S9